MWSLGACPPWAAKKKTRKARNLPLFIPLPRHTAALYHCLIFTVALKCSINRSHKHLPTHINCTVNTFFPALNAPPDAHSPSAADASHALLVTFFLLSTLALDISPTLALKKKTPLFCLPLLFLSGSILRSWPAMIWLSPSRALEVSLRSFQGFCFSTPAPFASFTETVSDNPLLPGVHLYQPYSQRAKYSRYIQFRSVIFSGKWFFNCFNLIWKKWRGKNPHLSCPLLPPDCTH